MLIPSTTHNYALQPLSPLECFQRLYQSLLRFKRQFRTVAHRDEARWQIEGEKDLFFEPSR